MGIAEFATVQGIVDGVRHGGAEAPTVDELVAALGSVHALRDEIAAWEPELVRAARLQGATWESLAPALGVASRQAAERRFLRLEPSSGGEQTAEDRVRATRARRAGDRAVVGWARDNAGLLRQLAVQVGAVTGLPAAGRRQAARVRAALNEDDPSALLDPLSGARAHLQTDHANLADQIGGLTERTRRVRRAAGEVEPKGTVGS